MVKTYHTIHDPKMQIFKRQFGKCACLKKGTRCCSMKKSGNALENLLQAQKDPFGAHTYGGLDGPRADLSHQPDRARRENRSNNVQ